MIKILLYFLGFLIGTFFVMYITDFLIFFDFKTKTKGKESFANTQSMIFKGPPPAAKKGKSIVRIRTKPDETPPPLAASVKSSPRIRPIGSLSPIERLIRNSKTGTSRLDNDQSILDSTISSTLRRKSSEDIIRENNNDVEALYTQMPQSARVIRENNNDDATQIPQSTMVNMDEGTSGSISEFNVADNQNIKLISSFYALNKLVENHLCNTKLNNLVSNNEIFENTNLIILYSVYNNNLKDNEWIPDNNFNKNLKFSYKCSVSSPCNIERLTFELNPYVQGINLNNIELSGPSCDLLKEGSNKSINEFSALFLMKIKGFKTLFNDLLRITTMATTKINDRTGRPESIDTSISIAFTNSNKNMQISNRSACNNNESCKKINRLLSEKINIHNTFYYYDKARLNYDVNLIEECNKNDTCKESLPLFQNQLSFFNQLLENEYYNIEIKVGSETFVIYNISESLFKTDSTLIGIIYKDKRITFYINDIVHEFDLLDTPSLVLAHNIPVKVNDNGNINCILYSFAYYKSAICEKDVHIFKMFNYYYMFGANKIYEEKQHYVDENKNLKRKIEK
jgi:hypothetical protein